MSELTTLTGSGAALYLVKQLFGKPVKEVGEIISDYVRAYRIQNLARIAERVQKTLRDRGLPWEIKPLPTGIGLALVEAASREDNDTLQTLWANLLANHNDPESHVELDKDLIEVLRQLSTVDARLMTYLSEQTADIHTVLAGGFDVPRLAAALALTPTRLARSINNLWRLGCLLQEAAGPHRLDGAGLHVVGPTDASNVSYQLSPLGEAILHAVRP